MNLIELDYLFCFLIRVGNAIWPGFLQNNHPVVERVLHQLRDPQDICEHHKNTSRKHQKM